MKCASLCLKYSDCIGFEILENDICNRIIFFAKLEQVPEGSDSAKSVWLSQTFTNNENYPQVKSKTFIFGTFVVCIDFSTCSGFYKVKC